MRSSVALDLKRAAVREAPRRFHAANPRVPRSVVQGSDREGSDLDALVDALPDAKLFDLSGQQADLTDLLSVFVDLVTPAGLPASIRQQVLSESVPL